MTARPDISWQVRAWRFLGTSGKKTSAGQSWPDMLVFLDSLAMSLSGQSWLDDQ